jgi:hypothetical protein
MFFSMKLNGMWKWYDYFSSKLLALFRNRIFKVCTLIVIGSSLFYIISNTINYIDLLREWSNRGDMKRDRLIQIVNDPVYTHLINKLGSLIKEAEDVVAYIENQGLLNPSQVNIGRQMIEEQKVLIFEKKALIKEAEIAFEQDTYDNFVTNTLIAAGVLGLSILTFSISLAYAQ